MKIICSESSTDGKVIVTLGDDYATLKGDCLINGERVNFPTPIKSFVWPCPITKFVRIVQYKETIGQTLKTGEVVSQSDYIAKYATLTEKRDEDGEWNDIDAEFAFKKWLDQFDGHTVYEDREREEEWEVISGKIPYSEYKEITPLWSYVTRDSADTSFICSLKMDIKEVFKMVGVEEGFELVAEAQSKNGEFNFESTKHSGIYFAKISGDYAFYDDLWKDRVFWSFRGSYDDCIKEREKVIQLIRVKFKKFRKLIEEKNLSEAERRSVVKELDSIITRIRGLDVKSKYQNDQYYLLKKVNELKDSLL